MTIQIPSATKKIQKPRIMSKLTSPTIRIAKININDHCFVEAPEEMFVIGNICSSLYKKEVLVVSIIEDDAEVRILNTQDILTIPTYCLTRKTKENFKPKNR